MARLFEEIKLRELTIPNRLWVASMCQYSAVDGVVNEWHEVHLSQFASGGAGLILSEAAAVNPEGRISPEDAGIWNDQQREAWARVTDRVHAREGLIGVQLGHAGRKASTWRPWAESGGSVDIDAGGWPTFAPSAIAYDGFRAPHAMTLDQIQALVEDFGEAATRAVAAGFDVVEIHAAHGYLIHQFLSPLTNQREDEYGGDFAGRTRLLIEIIREVRRAVGPNVPVFVRFSATDAVQAESGEPLGWTLENTISASALVGEAGADLLDISDAGLVPEQNLHPGPGYQVGYASAIRSHSDLPVAVVGLITDGKQAETILRAGASDVILAAREWLRDPHFALRAARELREQPAIPPQYARAYL